MLLGFGDGLSLLSSEELMTQLPLASKSELPEQGCVSLHGAPWKPVPSSQWRMMGRTKTPKLGTVLSTVLSTQEGRAVELGF